jgi:hypothetical protein
MRKIKRMMKIGIDLDNCITASRNSQAFFSLMTNALKESAFVYIITNRENSAESLKSTVSELGSMNIYFDHVEITADKEEFIIDKGITIYFDDTDEMYKNLPEEVVVFKIREPGNFDFDSGRWYYDSKTGIDIDNRK